MTTLVKLIKLVYEITMQKDLGIARNKLKNNLQNYIDFQ